MAELFKAPADVVKEHSLVCYVDLLTFFLLAVDQLVLNFEVEV